MTPREDSPRALASVIISCTGDLSRTKACLTALLKHTRSAWELVVVDGTADGATAAYLAGLRDAAGVPVTILEAPRRRDQATLRGLGIQAARGEFIVFLSEDAIVTDGWLEHLVALASASPTIGLAAPTLNAGPSEQRIAGAYSTLEDLQTFAARSSKPSATASRPGPLTFNLAGWLHGCGGLGSS